MFELIEGYLNDVRLEQAARLPAITSLDLAVYRRHVERRKPTKDDTVIVQRINKALEETPCTHVEILKAKIKKNEL